jgi:hypothetical protein
MMRAAGGNRRRSLSAATTSRPDFYADLGEFREVAATYAVRRTRFTVAETGESLPKTSEDQLAVSGVLSTGAIASIHYRGG